MLIRFDLIWFQISNTKSHNKLIVFGYMSFFSYLLVVKSLICMHHKLQEPNLELVKYHLSHVAP